jgi:aspartyl protease family protein
MGLTQIEIEIANPSRPARTEKLEFLVDSGAIYTVAPTRVLRRLGIRPLVKEEFILADGSKVVRRKGGALFKLGQRVGVSDVIFGEESDSQLLGALTLGALGLSLDPLRRELKPLPMILGGWRPPDRSSKRARRA